MPSSLGPEPWLYPLHCKPISALSCPLGVHMPWQRLGNVVWVSLVSATAKEALPGNYLMRTHMGTAHVLPEAA